jgi:hypothetical protein
VARLLFIQTIDRFGGFPVGMVCLSVESVGLILLWQAHSPWMALPAPPGRFRLFAGLSRHRRGSGQARHGNNRGTALGVYTAFADVSFFLTGPLAGAVIGVYGYASVFLFGLISVLAALGIVMCAAPGCRREAASILLAQSAGWSRFGVSCWQKRAQQTERVRMQYQRNASFVSPPLPCVFLHRMRH